MRLNSLLTLILVAGGLLTGCGKDADSERQGEETAQASEQSAYGIYLKNKEKTTGSDKREERLQQHREEKNHLASAILEQGLVDARQIEREVESYRTDLVVSRYFNDVLSEQVSDAAVRAYYDAHPEEFTRTRARFIHVRIPFGVESLPSKEQAFDQAMNVYQQLQSENVDAASLTDFGPAAHVFMPAENSYIDLTGVGAPIRDAVLMLKAGEASEPILDGNEYVLVKLLEPVQESVSSFGQAAEAIRFKLNNETRIREKERLLSAE